MRAAKTDANQTAIVEALRARGHRVQSLAGVGKGVPDLLVGARVLTTKYTDGKPMPNLEFNLMLLELKVARNKRGDLEPLNALEAKWHRAWKDWPVYVVGSVEEAIRVVERAT